MQYSEIENVKSDFSMEIEKVSDAAELEQIRIKYLSRNGIVTKLFDELKTLSPDEKPKFGKYRDISLQPEWFSIWYDCALLA